MSNIYFLYVNIRILGFRTHLGITFSAFMTHLGITIICFSITFWDEIIQLFSLLLTSAALEIPKETHILNAENKDFTYQYFVLIPLSYFLLLPQVGILSSWCSLFYPVSYDNLLGRTLLDFTSQLMFLPQSQ